MSRGLVSVRDVGFGFPVAFALLIELVSAFGPVGIATYAAATRYSHTTGVRASPPETIAHLEHHPVGAVVDYVAERTVPGSQSSAIGDAELHKDYLRRCTRTGSVGLSLVDFTAEFDRLRELPALRGKIRKFGARYFVRGNCNRRSVRTQRWSRVGCAKCDRLNDLRRLFAQDDPELRMTSAGKRMKPEAAQQRRLVRAVYSRRGEGVVVPFQAVMAADWVPSQFWCHANTRAWVEQNTDWKVVHGWLLDEKGGGILELFAHSVVASPDGVLVDVTPSPLPPVLPFIAHRGSKRLRGVHHGK
jgi:hypothetical protein